MMKKMLLNIAVISMIGWQNVAASPTLSEDEKKDAIDSQTQQVKTNVSYFDNLPTELQLLICQQASVEDIQSLMQSSKHLNELITGSPEIFWALTAYKLNRDIGDLRNSDPSLFLIKSILNGKVQLDILDESVKPHHIHSIQDNGHLIMKKDLEKLSIAYIPMINVQGPLSQEFKTTCSSPNGKVYAGKGVSAKQIFITTDNKNAHIFDKLPNDAFFTTIKGVTNSGGVLGNMMLLNKPDENSEQTTTSMLGFYGHPENVIKPLPLLEKATLNSSAICISVDENTIGGYVGFCHAVSFKSGKDSPIKWSAESITVRQEATVWIARKFPFNLNELFAQSSNPDIAKDYLFQSINGMSFKSKGLYGSLNDNRTFLIKNLIKEI